MTQIVWAQLGDRFYETGIDKGVLYVGDNPGVAWNGIVSMSENPSGGDPKPYYLDGVKYLNYSAREEYESTLSAFYSPAEFDVCDGMVAIRDGFMANQQRRVPFGLTYRTKIGNDLAGPDYGYKIHLIYNALAQPTQHNYSTLSDKADIPVLAWTLTTKAIVNGAGMPSAHYVIDTTLLHSTVLADLEGILYGTDVGTPRLPLPAEIAALFDDDTPFVVTDLTGGLYSVSGSIDEVTDLTGGAWMLTSDSVVTIDDDSATVSSA